MKPYPRYKPSGIEWIGSIPEHWRADRVKYVTHIEISNVDKKSKPDEPDVLLCNYTDVYNNEFITPEMDFMSATASIKHIRRLSLKKGDVIITKDSETPEDIAVPALVNQDLDGTVCGYHLALLRPNKGVIVGGFLLRLLQTKNINDQFAVCASGVTRFGVSTYPIKNSYLIIPPLEEQRQISEYLNQKTHKIDQLIEKKQKLIELLKEQRAAIINQAVTKGLNPNVKMKDSGVEWLGEIPEHWEVKKLKHVAEIILGKMLTNDDKGGYFHKPYLRAQNIEWERVNIDDVKQMWFSANELKQYRLKAMDLLVSEGGEVGRTAIWKDEVEECYIQNSVHKVTMFQDNNPFYFLYLFFFYGKIGYFDSIVSKVSIAHLTKEKLKEIFCLIPPVQEQDRIWKHIKTETARIDQTIAKIEKEIELLQEYRTALISEAVTGKIDVREE